MFLLWPTILLLYSGRAIALKQVKLKSIAAGDKAPLHLEPQVAVLCEPKSGQMYYNQYMGESGRWTSDMNSVNIASLSKSCKSEKFDILEYCKKVYPTRDITNIVESSHFTKITNWCKVGRSKCQKSEWVKPYRCLEGPFQSDALLVPEKCIFDHIHNQSRCWPFGRWNETASTVCQEREMNLRSFAMLLPCGISLFSGVEFVCCPNRGKKITLPNTMSNQFDLDDDIIDDDDDADADDDLDDSDNDYDETDDNGMSTIKPSAARTTKLITTITLAPTNLSITSDPYFIHFDPHEEHRAFNEAQSKLEHVHREKITKVMKDWSDLKEQYRKMKQKDPHMAEEFKHQITLRFQRTVQSLKEEEAADKHQLMTMHQQRINAHINQRIKDAMNCYTRALNDDPPNTHRVQKFLQKLLKLLHKNRQYTIAHYKNLVTNNVEQAEREKAITLEHLVYIDHMVNQSLQMLDRYPLIYEKIAKLMYDYMQALRSKDETSGSLTLMTKEAETAGFHKSKNADVITLQKDKISDEKRFETARKVSMKFPKVEIKATETKDDEVQVDFDAETSVIDDRRTEIQASTVTPSSTPLHIIGIEHHETDPQFAHALNHDFTQGEPIYAIRKETYHRGPQNLYFMLALAGFTLITVVLVGVSVIRRIKSRLPLSQGFIDVDQVIITEEHHVVNMQVNGYENPTYKYFEVKD